MRGDDTSKCDLHKITNSSVRQKRGPIRHTFWHATSDYYYIRENRFHLLNIGAFIAAAILEVLRYSFIINTLLMHGGFVHHIACSRINALSSGCMQNRNSVHLPHRISSELISNECVRERVLLQC